ncbi:MAG TPA: peptidylprolyl isomerase [Roseiflexaceae bacterium]
MAQAKHGDTVKVHYTGKLDDDRVFDSSRSGEPLKFTLGAGQMIPGFEEAVLGMQPGELRTASIPADQAYGAYQPDMVLAVDRSQFPADIEPEVGQQFELRQPDGQSTILTVMDVAGSQVTLDANHPLAGADLTFEIELMAIV